MVEDTEILSVNDVCRYLKIPKNTIYKMCRTGEIPSFKAGKQIRFRKLALTKWMEQQERKRSRKK